MSGRDGVIDRPHEAALAAALRALPESAPTPDLWPDLARTLGRPRRRVWRYALPGALAAGLALALVLPRLFSHDRAAPVASTPAATSASSASGAEELAQLRERSQTLERWIGAIAARAPQNSRDLMAAVEVEDMIGLVDVELAAADPNATLPLWRRRVALLQDLAILRYGANLTQFDGGLAVNEAAAGDGAAPATWNN